MDTSRQSLYGWREKLRGRFGHIAPHPLRTAVRPAAVPTVTSNIDSRSWRALPSEMMLSTDSSDGTLLVAPRPLAERRGENSPSPGTSVRTMPESDLGSGHACDAGRVSGEGLHAVLLLEETERFSTL